MRTRIIAAAAALIVALAAAMAISSPGFAADSEHSVDVDWNTDHPKECSEMAHVTGCVQPVGDDLWLKDNIADGQPVVIYWAYNDYSRYGYCYDTLGAAKAWTMCNKDWTDGQWLRWSVGYWSIDRQEWIYGAAETTWI